MKSHSNKPLSLLAILLLAIAPGCLKDRAYNNGEIQSGQGSKVKVISIGTNVLSQENFLNLALNSSPHDTVINLIPVMLGASSPAQQDIHITLIQDSTLIINYNSTNGTDYTIPTAFTVVNPGGIVTIPKASYVGYLQVKFVPDDFINGGPYAVGYTIKSIAENGYTISGNLQNGIAAIGIKNKYDGNYGLVIRTTGWAVFGISDDLEGTWPVAADGTSIGMVTAGANSVKLFDYAGGSGFAQIGFATDNASIISFGNASPKFTFDPITNLLTDVTNDVIVDSRNRQFHTNPGVADSRFDPATKTMYLAYTMTQNGRPTQFIYDTLSYIGGRP